MSVRNHGLWPYVVKPGDVLINGAGTLRVVQRATTPEGSFTTHVHFIILRCSWTRRSYTVVNYIDLKSAGYMPTGKRGRINKRVLADIGANWDDRKIYCWDVV